MTSTYADRGPLCFFFFSSRGRHTRCLSDWSSDVCSSDLHHRRFGDVWVPANRPRGWRPYTVGHWVYTDDYGWYWVTDDQEADWGWIAYHYGRWYRDADYGWCWIANDVWGPALGDLRHGGPIVGLAPEPPDEGLVEMQDEPGYWRLPTR